MSHLTRGAEFQQRGSTLIISIVLLLLLTLVGLFALNVGMSEQRASGQEFRGRIVRQVAEASLAQTFEYLRMSGRVPTIPAGEIDLTRWQPCTAADTTFPCGVVEQTVVRDADGDGAIDDTVPFRGASYRWIGGGGFDMNANGTIDNLERYMIPMPNIKDTTTSGAVTQVGNFPVQVGVGAVLCSLDNNRVCTTLDEDRSGLATVTLVAVAQIPGENARATVVQSYGSFNILSVPPSAPPLMAAGVLKGAGTATIVANPNSGGVGVPVSIWAQGPLDGNNGTWQTCQLDEYMRSGIPGYDSGVVICSDCACPATARLSFKDKDAGVGMDIQAPSLSGGGYRPDTLPSQYFPCDVFEYVFGVRMRQNTNAPGPPVNGIEAAEAGLPYGVCEDGTDVDANGRVDVFDDFLEGIEAKEIRAGATDPDNADRAITTCADLNTGSNGIYWFGDSTVSGTTRTDANTSGAPICRITGSVGSAANPVVVISEGGFRFGMNRGERAFGVFIAINPNTVDINEGDLDGSFTTEVEPGGGQSQVYGAVIVEGGGKFNAGIDLIASPKVIQNINDSENFRRFGTVPGSWTDRFSF